MERVTNRLADQLLEDFSDRSGSSQQYALSLEESRVATLMRSKKSRNSGDLVLIHCFSFIRFLSGRSGRLAEPRRIVFRRGG